MTLQSALLAAGSNSSGQLGLDHNDDVNILQACQCDDGTTFPPRGMKVLQLSAGSNHTVALLCSRSEDDALDNDLQLWGCGAGNHGQLGKSVYDEITSFRRLHLGSYLDTNTLAGAGADEDIDRWWPVKVACGWNSTFVAIRHRDEDQDDLLIVMGKDNDFGQLGLRESKQIHAGIGLVRLRHESNIRGVLRIEALACGLRHSVVQCRYVSKDSPDRVQVLGWGAARHGQLDTTSASKYPSSYWYPHLVDEWDGSTERPQSAILAAGKEHTVYTRGDDSLQIIGSNRQGQRLVGDVVKSHSVLAAACTWNATLVLLQDSIIGSGNNNKGQLGSELRTGEVAKVGLDASLQSTDEGDRSIASLICGSEHTLTLIRKEGTEGGQVWGWGWNEHGNLAQGDQEDRSQPVRIWPHRSTNTSSALATDVWAGCGTTFVQIRESTVESSSILA